MISNTPLHFLYKSLFLAFFLCAFCLNLEAQTIKAYQKDTIIIDNGASGKADPLDRIRYIVTIKDTLGPNATGVQLNVVPDPRTTFVAGSFRSSPLAINDSYTSTGNVGINVPVGSGVLVNDFDDNIPGLTVTAGTFATTGGGSIMINADGSFMYTPAAGFSGNDTYVYTLNDANGVGGGVPTTDVATITITIAIGNMIWFIDNTGGGSGGTGTLANPFKTLANFNASASLTTQVIYIEETGINYDGGIVLKNTQRLFGEGHTGGANLASIGVLPFAMAPHSKTLPNINGTRPVITNTSAGGDGIQLAIGNHIRGLNVGNSTDYAMDNIGNIGAITISEVNIANVLGGGFSAELGGSPAVTLGSLSSAGGVAGISLASMGGAGFFTITGAVTIGGQSGDGIVLTSNSASFTINGLTTINAPAPASVGNSIGIVSTSGPVTFANIDINGRRNIGLLISTNSNTITTGTVDIDNSNTVNAIGLSINAPSSGSISLGATTVNNNAVSAAGINILTSGATVTFASGSAVSNSNGNEINIDGGAANVTYNGSVTGTAGGTVRVVNRTGGTIDFQGTITHNAAAVAIQVSSNSGGTLLFSGGTKTLNSSTQSAVSLTSNTGTTMNFTNGGLAITTTSGTGFNATGGGTVNVTGSVNTISSTTGTALNVTSTTIGTSDLNFQSIAHNGGTNGIILSNTGTAGGLIVIGTGTANSGGIIQNTTGVGISMTNASNVSLNRMQISNTGSHGISGTGMTDGSGGVAPTFEILNSLLNSPGDADNESAIYFDALGVTNITGRLVVTNCTIQDFEDVGIHVGNISGTLTIDVDDVTINNNSDTNGEEGIDIDASGTATINVNITDSRFQDLEGGSMNIVSQGSGTIDLNVNNIVDIGAGGPDNFPTPPVMTFSAEGSSSNFFFDITNNKLLDVPGDGIFIGHEGEIMGRITGNVITGVTLGDGIRIDTDVTSNQTSTILIQNNQIGSLFNFESVNYSGIGDDGIQVLHRDGTKTMNLTIDANTIANTASEAIRYFADDDVAGGGPENLVKISANTFSTIGDPNTIVVISQDNGTNVCTHITGNTLTTGNLGVTLQQSVGTATLQITQANTAALAAANDGGATVVSTTGTITFNGTCTNPPLPNNP